MFGGLYVSGALTGLLHDFLDAEGLAAPHCRARLAAWPPDARMPLSEWLGLLELIADIVPRPALGLAIGQRVQPRHAGVMGYLGLSCDTLGEALLRFARYHRLVYDGNPVEVDIATEGVRISWGIAHGKPGQLPDETAIAAFATLTRLLVDQPICAQRVEFVNAAPDDTSPYETFFGCPVSFAHARTTVQFSADHLALPIRYRDPGLRALLEQQAESLLHALPQRDAFETTLRQALIRQLHNGEPTLEGIAHALHVSPRTLQRRLAERQLQFKPLLETTRRALAHDYLGDPNLALTEIALLLGYSEQSAFSRAFRRWTGQTPKAFRRQGSQTRSEPLANR
ncbi:MAG: AraC family transcriptional regulator [Moraxellaceae bacterium]|nr:AraC family transcriptional regulator [Moraxellaceae bacterium]